MKADKRRLVSSGKRYSRAEDAIIRMNVIAGRQTADFIDDLPCRSAASINARAVKLGLLRRPSGDQPRRLRHRNLYLEPYLDQEMEVVANTAGVTWSEFVVEAIASKIKQHREGLL